MNAGIDKPVILFDGLCNLCQGSVQFVLKHDRKKQFQFASLQSPVADKLLEPYNLISLRPDSFVLIEDGKLFMRSTAALRVCRKVNWPLPFLYGFIILPAFLRDMIYNLIARKRYQWFGKMNECWIPTPEISSRFLDQSDVHLP